MAPRQGTCLNPKEAGWATHKVSYRTFDLLGSSMQSEQSSITGVTEAAGSCPANVPPPFPWEPAWAYPTMVKNTCGSPDCAPPTWHSQHPLPQPHFPRLALPLQVSVHPEVSAGCSTLTGAAYETNSYSHLSSQFLTRCLRQQRQANARFRITIST